MAIPIASLLDRTRWAMPLRAAKTLWYDYGHLRSAREGLCVDADGHAIPWYTYPAIEYLKQLDFSSKDVFEFGSGQSTLFWAGRARRVVSVEDDEAWYAIVSKKVPRNCKLVLETDLAQYPDQLHRCSESFDVIVVDGAARGKTRLKCCRAAVEHLRPGGMIILDNADWLPQSSAFLRDSGLIEVDMTGLVPLAGHTQTTSLFLHRAFAFPPKGRQPQPGPGATTKNWETASPLEPPVVEFDGETFGAVERDLTFENQIDGAPRHFRMITSRKTADRPASGALFDVDRQRVLLFLNEPTAKGFHTAASVADELAACATMPGEAFRAFINAHPRRRYCI